MGRTQRFECMFVTWLFVLPKLSALNQVPWFGTYLCNCFQAAVRQHGKKCWSLLSKPPPRTRLNSAIDNSGNNRRKLAWQGIEAELGLLPWHPGFSQHLNQLWWGESMNSSNFLVSFTIPCSRPIENLHCSVWVTTLSDWFTFYGTLTSLVILFCFVVLEIASVLALA